MKKQRIITLSVYLESKMNKLKINHLIVVEGSQDESYILSFFYCFTFVINGLDINKEKINYLQNVSKVRKIILLTDPDKEGENIRNKINNEIPNCINVILDINKCNKNNKHGVKECEKEELINKLTPFVSKKLESGDIDFPFLYSLNIDFDIIKKKYSLGKVNNKTFIKRLNCLLITKESIKNGN